MKSDGKCFPMAKLWDVLGRLGGGQSSELSVLSSRQRSSSPKLATEIPSLTKFWSGSFKPTSPQLQSVLGWPSFSKNAVKSIYQGLDLWLSFLPPWWCLIILACLLQESCKVCLSRTLSSLMFPQSFFTHWPLPAAWLSFLPVHAVFGIQPSSALKSLSPIILITD